jgi:hypothetical protein
MLEVEKPLASRSGKNVAKLTEIRKLLRLG